MAIRKIVSRSIGTDVIAAEDLAANSVTVAEITDGAVTSAKMNGLTGSSSGIIQADGDGSLSTTTVDLTSRVEVAGDTMTGALKIQQSSTGATASSDKDDLVIENNSDHSGITVLSADNKESGIFLGHASSNRVGEIYTKYSDDYMNIGTRKSGMDLKFYSGAFANNMTIDSNGYVLKPNQPAFLSQGRIYQYSNPSSNYYYMYIDEASGYDIGSNLDSSTSIFTAPVDGIYIFSFKYMVSQSVNDGHIAISVNNNYNSGRGGYTSNEAWWIQDAGANDQLHGNWLCQLSSGDTVRPLAYSDAANTSNLATNGRAFFFGYLLG